MPLYLGGGCGAKTKKEDIVLKLSDLIAKFLLERGVRHVFAFSGGASAHLIDSIGQTPGIDFICNQHEQASAMAADAYSRVSRNLAAVIATSGPGATNLLTGVCCSYYDSIPLLCLTGQVSSFRLKRGLGVRQLGFQESDVVDIFRPVTKYAVQLESAEQILFELEKCAAIAQSGRPGPVLLDIPDNFQREAVEPDKLTRYTDQGPRASSSVTSRDLDACIEMINRAQRPVLVLGWGIYLSRAEKAAIEVLNLLQFPTVMTWALGYLLPHDHPHLVGPFGTFGTRYGNFAVQNADLILSIGARLDTREAGSPATSFARRSEKIIVDIDRAEIEKLSSLGMNPDLTICCDAQTFLDALIARKGEFQDCDRSAWNAQIRQWKTRYPICPTSYRREKHLNPYVFVKELSRVLSSDAILLVDSGCSVAWTSQAFDYKSGQQLFSAFNNTPMGYALPAAIGACFAADKRPVICVTGDGGLQINIQEFATIVRHRLPIKVFLFNNHCYGMIQQTQEQWLGARYYGSSIDGGLAFPDFVKVAKAYGLKTFTARTNRQVRSIVAQTLAAEGPVLCNLEIPSTSRVVPTVRYGRPIEDSEPLLERDEFCSNMLVDLDPRTVEK